MIDTRPKSAILQARLQRLRAEARASQRGENVPPICNASSRQPYDGAELRPFDRRAGAMTAATLPSRIGRHRLWPDGRVEVVQ